MAAILILGFTTAPLSAGAVEQSARDAAQARISATNANAGRVGIGASGLDLAASKNSAIADQADRVEQARLAAEAAQAAADAAAAQAAADAAALAAAAEERAVQEAATNDVSDSTPWTAPSAAPDASSAAADLGPAPANDTCGPCVGATLVPVVYDGVTYWGCPE